CAELDQRQHLRRDDIARRPNPVRRDMNNAVRPHILPRVNQLDQRFLVFAQQREQRRGLQDLLFPSNDQFIPSDRKPNIFFIELAQQFNHSHNTISFIFSVTAAISASLDVVTSARTSACRPSFRMRSSRFTASSEWPPRSKKSSWRPTLSTLST